MTEAEARAILVRRTAATTSPTLSTSGDGNDIDALLSAFLVEEGSWRLYAAAAEGLRWKAGQRTNRVSVDSDGQAAQYQQEHANLLKQAAEYDRLSGLYDPAPLTGGDALELLCIEVGC